MGPDPAGATTTAPCSKRGKEQPDQGGNVDIGSDYPVGLPGQIKTGWNIRQAEVDKGRVDPLIKIKVIDPESGDIAKGQYPEKNWNRCEAGPGN